MRAILRAFVRAAALLLSLTVASAQGATTVVDLAGRSVSLPDKVERIILGEGRMLSALAILEGSTLPGRVVGMLEDFERLDPAGYELYRQRFPALQRVVRLGRGGASFSVEEAIALKPDLAIFSLRGHGPDVNDAATLARLQAAGISVVYVDFTKNPLEDTARSIKLLGRVLGREAEAAAYLAWHRQEMDKVRSRIARVKQRPTVFLDSRVGLAAGCCETLTHGMMGLFIEAAGGRNIAADLVPGVHGTVSLEWLLTRQPEVYIGTAIGNPASVARGAPTIALGAGIEPDVAAESLLRSLRRPGIAQLQAVRSGRAHAVWHHFNYLASNPAALQAVAKWLHPALFADIDPQATLADYYRRFQPITLTGTYWTSPR
ncbi:ABC transporter substrate-binding protein [Paucibacter sp. XJ19-41]|uniref:ABC transporter substrate-binding protein n=1 Tax=Paucibacter sp. XJ19-41 TaxID=2927824 RepID=UPI00234B614D|nr:ABC transporter substrate-binding protein [Paucibacter sp. XJ19-41]MDC6166800.1 ABC transporter substrate-binding protein [Paucibacter sp. XJ19-41]